jgi:SAM-dependent methyltransferase
VTKAGDRGGVAWPAEEFNDAAYLGENPDVMDAVSRGDLPSAWCHYVTFGFFEGRKGVPEAIRVVVSRLFEFSASLPPEQLITRVQGSNDPLSFIKTGNRIAMDICRHSAPLINFSKAIEILEFGVGCGRVLSPMMILAPSAHFVGSDVDREAVAWCQEQFAKRQLASRVEFTSNNHFPPLPFASCYFDFVYVVSVFTHLPETMQNQWLEELARITKWDGALAISVAGDRLIREHLNPEMRTRLDSDGFFYYPYGSTQGLPEYYQAAWHTREYIWREWSKYFDIIDLIPSAIADHQDLVLCRKKRSL